MDATAYRPMLRTLAAAGAGLALLAACSNGGGGGSSGATTTTQSTAFSTIPIQTTTTPAPLPGQVQDGSTATTGATGGDGASYTVVANDYLLGIAKKLGVTLQSLLDANGLTTSSLITPGQKLKIPAASADNTATTTAGGSATTSAGTTTTTAADAPGTYTVRPNDGWSIIASRLGVDAGDLAAFNDLTVNSVLIPGQKLRIPPTRTTTTKG